MRSRHCHGLYIVDLYPGEITRHSEVWLDVHEAAAYCGVVQETVRRWIASGRVRARKELMQNHSQKWYCARSSLPFFRAPIARIAVKEYLDCPDIKDDETMAAFYGATHLVVMAVVDRSTGKITTLTVGEG